MRPRRCLQRRLPAVTAVLSPLYLPVCGCTLRDRVSKMRLIHIRANALSACPLISSYPQRFPIIRKWMRMHSAAVYQWTCRSCSLMSPPPKAVIKKCPRPVVGPYYVGNSAESEIQRPMTAQINSISGGSPVRKSAERRVPECSYRWVGIETSY